MTNEAIKLAFDARSRNSWSAKPIEEALLRQLYDAVKLGPTSMNCCPARFRFITSLEAKERLAAHAMGANQPKILAAPCTVIIATDETFYEALPRLFPIREGMKEWFASDADMAATTAFRNSTLQGGYLITAARLLGLDCGAMSGFDPAGVDSEFFSGTTFKSNFLCSIGYADDEVMPRLPRFDFDDVAEIL